MACLAAPQFSTTLNVVNVYATARDGHGRVVKDLRREEFRYFARETDAPLTVGLVVDTSASTRMAQDRERDASRELRAPRRPREANGGTLLYDAVACVAEAVEAAQRAGDRSMALERMAAQRAGDISR